MHKYDYSFLKDKLSSNLVGACNLIVELNAKENIRKLQYEDSFKALKNKAVIESVKASNAIEGIITTDARIKNIVNGAKPLNHNEQEIYGYKDALNIIHKNYKKIEFDENLILSLHKTMEKETGSKDAGKYKTKDNLIIEYDTDGNRNIRFTPVKAKETKKAMQQLMLAYYDARQDSNIIDLFLIPCVIVDFLCVHPFFDGNGRISRLLTVLLLYQSGYDIGRYISIEKQIDKYKDNYYDALKESSKLWHENKNNYEPFILFFLQIIYRCYKDLDDSFMELSLKKAKKSERIEYILKESIVPISKLEISNKLPDVSIKTIESTLSKLLKEKKIKKIGSYKDARYISN